MKRLCLLALLFTTSTLVAEEIKINSIDDLKNCAQKNSYDTGVCFNAFEKFVNKNPNQALEAAKIGRTMFAQWAVLPMFEKAYSKSKNVEICKDKDFQLSLFNALGQPKDNPSFKIAQNFLKSPCAPHLVEMATKELTSYAGPTEIENLCPLLKTNGKTHSACETKMTKETTNNEAQEETLPTLDKSKIKLGLIKVYTGPEMSRVTMAEVTGQENVYLLKFSNIKGPWNNKTIIHKSHKVNNHGSMDYWTQHNGSRWNSLAFRNCYGGHCMVTAFAPEIGTNQGLLVSLNEQESTKVKAQDIISTL